MKGVVVSRIEPVHIDERGRITDLLNENINHVGLITFSKGSVRGNHYHKLSKQYSYTLSGTFRVHVARIDSLNDVEEIILNEGEIIIIEPGIVHVFEAITDAVMIDMISESRAREGFENDTVKGIKLVYNA